MSRRAVATWIWVLRTRALTTRLEQCLVVQQNQPAVSEPPPVLATSESQDVEMTDAQPAKAPEPAMAAVPDAGPEKTPSTVATTVANPAPASHRDDPTNEVVPSVAPPQEDSKPAQPDTAAGEPAASSAPPIQEEAPSDGAGKEAKVAHEAPAEISAPKTVEPPAEKGTEKPETAEDASVKMLAANLDTPVNGAADEDAELKAPAAEVDQLAGGAEPPVAGAKRKADSDVEANGDATNKKPNVEATQPEPTTNGSVPTRKAGRPKKEKKAPAPVGRTARRTRSQGAADV